MLLGDAYRTVTPNLAQGAAVAIEDATNLAAAVSRWCKARNWASIDAAAALQKHSEQSTLRSTRHAQMTRFTHTISCMNGCLTEPIRNAMSLVPAPINSRIFDAALNFSGVGPVSDGPAARYAQALRDATC